MEFQILTEPSRVADVEIMRDLTSEEQAFLEEYCLAHSDEGIDFWLSVFTLVENEERAPGIIKEIIEQCKADYDYVRIN